MTILEAIRDPKLFGQLFNGDSWRRWYVCLAATYAVPIEDLRPFGLSKDEAFDIYVEHTGRLRWPDRRAKEAWRIGGRRTGKSRVNSVEAAYRSAFHEYPMLTPGERGVYTMLASDKDQAAILRRYTGSLFEEIPMLAAMVERTTQSAIHLRNHVTIEIVVAHYGRLRGRTCIGATVEEVAFWTTADGAANPDSEVMAALRPTMLTVSDALLVGISSPYAKRGELYRIYKAHWAKDDSDVLVWKAGTLQMNPLINPREIERAMVEDPAAARSEYYAEFRDDISNFLDREQVEALIEGGVEQRPYQSRHRYFAHCDPSGGRGDSMTMAIGHMEGATLILDYLGERQPPFDPEFVVGDFADALKSYGLRLVQTDNYAAEWVPSAFRRVGIDAHVSEMTTSDHYRGLLPLITTKTIRLLDSPRLVNQLSSLERRVSPGGRELIGHPPKLHDDLAAALSGMAAQASRPGTAVACFAHVSHLL